VVYLDFETYYKLRSDADGPRYSLGSMTTEAYIMDPLYQTIGFSYATGGEPARWVTGSDDYIAARLRELNLETQAVAAHNCLFDALILSLRYGIRPAALVDTLSMSAVAGIRGTAGGSLAKLAVAFEVGVKGEDVIQADGLRREDFPPDQLARYGEYCCNDTELMRAIYHRLLPHIPNHELRTISMTLKMATRPVIELDKPMLEERLVEVQVRKAGALALLSERLGMEPENLGVALRSSDRFAELLRAHGVEPGRKLSPTNPTQMTYAFAKTDAFMAGLLEHADPLVVVLAETRIGERSNIEENRLARFIGVADRLGVLPVVLNVSGAHTHRYSSGDALGIQNLPKRAGADLTLRRSMRAPDGHVLIGVDSSQVEVRVLAYMTDDKDMLDIFRSGRDPYSEQAVVLYGGTADEIKAGAKAGIEPYKTQRLVAKEAVISCGYGVGKDKFHDRLRQYNVVIPLTEAERIVDGYRSSRPKVTAFWAMCRRVIAVMTARGAMEFGGPDGKLFKVNVDQLPGRSDVSPYIELPNRTRIWYHGLTAMPGKKGSEYTYWQGKINKRIYPGLACENLSQALSFAVLKWQALKMDAAGIPMILNVHDEYVTAVPIAIADATKDLMVEMMSATPPWCQGLPLAAEGAIGDNYSEC